MTIDYHKKYLKYKKKYLEAKKIYGGVSKIEGGGFSLGQGDQGQDKKDWEGGWRLRPKGKLKNGQPNNSTLLEIKLWNYLWVNKFLPPNVLREMDYFLIKPTTNKWVSEELEDMIYNETIDYFPTIIEDVTPEIAIHIMESITKILQNRISEEVRKFAEKDSWRGHTYKINHYIRRYKECVEIMNKQKNLFNGIEKREKNGRPGSERHYDVILYTGPWREGVEQAEIDKKNDIKRQKEAADRAKKNKNVGSESKKSSKENEVVAEKMAEMFHEDTSKTKITKGEAKKFKKEEKEKELAHKKNIFMNWVDKIINDDPRYSESDRDILINMWDDVLLKDINWASRKGRGQIKEMVEKIVEDKEKKKKRKELKKQKLEVSKTLERIIKDKLENNENPEEIYKVVEEKWKEISGHKVAEFENTEKLRSFFDKIIEDLKKKDSASVDKYQLRSAASQHPEWKSLALNDEPIKKSESPSMPKSLSQHPERKYLALNDEPQNDEFDGAAPSGWVVPTTRTLTSSNSRNSKGKGNGKSSNSSKKSPDKKKKKK